MVHRGKIADFAPFRRLPSMYGWREYCDVGGFASYGSNQRATYRRSRAMQIGCCAEPNLKSCQSSVQPNSNLS
jgi:hypothetical protein